MAKQIHPSAYRYVLTFGTQIGKSLGEIAERRPDYLEWLSGAESMPMNWRVAAAKVMMGESVDTLGLPTRVIPAPNTTKLEMFVVDPAKEKVLLRFPKNDKVKDALKETVDGVFWNQDEFWWEFPREQVVKAVEFFGGTSKVYADTTVRQWYTEEKRRKAKLDEIRVKQDADIDIPGLIVNLRPFQKVAVVYGIESGNRWMDADAMGLGKTPTGLAWALVVGGLTLIVTTASTTLQWIAQAKKFTGKKATLWTTKGREDVGKTQFHVIGYDAVAKNIQALRKMGFNNLICDEATKLKSYKTVRYKALFGVRSRSAIEQSDWPGLDIPNVVLLTGTPLLNRPIELFTLLSILDRKRFNNPKHFLNRYGGSGGYGEARNLGELYQRATELMIRRTKKIVADELPGKEREPVILGLEEAEKRAYDKHVDQLFRQWRVNGRPSAAQMPAIRNYLFDIKFPRLIEMVEESLANDNAILVFTIHRPHAEKIAAHFGANARMIHGGVPIKKREQQKQDVIAGKAKVMVMTIGAGGMGIDGLQEVISDAIFVDRWWVPGDHEQAEDRIYRIGQKNPTMHYYLTVEGTVDEDMAAVLAEKQRIIDEAVEGKRPDDREVAEARSGSIFSEVVRRMAASRKEDIPDPDAIVEVISD
jgi:SWI/SNF-related matrix-associated actin-dependent regulator 1 of chromatin subfamily A